MIFLTVQYNGTDRNSYFAGVLAVIWASPFHLTLAIWVMVRVTGDAHITRVFGMGKPKTRGCPYHCHTGRAKGLDGSLDRLC